jgi:hypothetical protein
MPPAGFELAIPASEGQQTYALDRAATGIGSPSFIYSHKGTQLSNQQNIKIHFIHEILQSQVDLNWLSERPHLF